MKKRILILIPNLGAGGAQRVFHQHLTILSSEFDVTGCVFNWDGTFEYDRKVCIVSLDVPAGKTLIQKVRNFFLRVKRLKEIKAAKKIDIAISHLEGADYVNLLSAVGEKSICWIHGSKSKDGNIKGLIGFLRVNVLMPFLYKRADHIVSVSGGVALDFSRYVSKIKSSSVIYNGFNVQQIRSNAEKLTNGVDEFMSLEGVRTIVTHCRLASQKNLTLLIACAEQLLKNDKSLKLIIIGDGDLRRELIAKGKSFGLNVWTVWGKDGTVKDANVIFTGHLSNPFPFLKNASLYVMTSLWEGFPLSLGEALACDLPVVAGDCEAGPREILAPEISSNYKIDSPHFGTFGVLLPIGTENEISIVSIWSSTLMKLIYDDKILNQYRERAKIRIADLSDVKMAQGLISVINAV